MPRRDSSCEAPTRCEYRVLETYLSPYTGQRHETRQCRWCDTVYHATLAVRDNNDPDTGR